MLKKLKKKLYFLVASYFVFWAKLVLRKWQPKIIVVTGSTGKTTLFSLLRSQLSEEAEFADKANSAFGIPFNILGLERKSFSVWEWIWLIVKAPGQTTKKPLRERKKLYVVEADSDRPGEAKVIAHLLKPEIVLMLNVYQTHAMNFESLAAEKQQPVLQVIAEEFATFATTAKEKVLVNGDNVALVNAIDQLSLPPGKVEFLQEQDYLLAYSLTTSGTDFTVEKHKYHFNELLPEEVWVSLAMVDKVSQMLTRRVNEQYPNLIFPGGRSGVLQGIKNTTLIDSTYNANLGSMEAILKLFEQYPAVGPKWLVLGHMLEEGTETTKQHEALAWLVLQTKTIERIFLVGKENLEVTLPLLQQYFQGRQVEYFETPKMLLQQLSQDLQGGETILFKGAPFLEGMVERLLADKNDTVKLVRREPIWEKRRQNFYA